MTLTIGTKLQSQVAQAVLATGAPEAAAIVIDPKTGAIEAMYGTPTFDPNPLVQPDTTKEKQAWQALTPDSGLSPLVSRVFQRGWAPGSTFKTVTSAAVYDHQPALAKVDYPVVGCISLKPQSDKPLCNYGNGAEQCGGVLDGDPSGVV